MNSAISLSPTTSIDKNFLCQQPNQHYQSPNILLRTCLTTNDEFGNKVELDKTECTLRSALKNDFEKFGKQPNPFIKDRKVGLMQEIKLTKSGMSKLSDCKNVKGEFKFTLDDFEEIFNNDQCADKSSMNFLANNFVNMFKVNTIEYGIAVCIIAYLFSKIIHPILWNCDMKICHEIFYLAHDFYLKSLSHYYETRPGSNFLKEHLKLAEFMKYYCIHNYKIEYTICQIHTIGQIESEDLRIYDLRRALSNFFMDTNKIACILETKVLSILIWRNSFDNFFIFDPINDRDHHYLRTTSSFEQMIDVLRNDTSITFKANSKTWFSITEIQLKSSDLDCESKECKKYHIDYNRNIYQLILPNEAILINDRAMQYSTIVPSLAIAFVTLIYINSGERPANTWKSKDISNIIQLSQSLVDQNIEVVFLNIAQVPLKLHFIEKRRQYHIEYDYVKVRKSQICLSSGLLLREDQFLMKFKKVFDFANFAIIEIAMTDNGDGDQLEYFAIWRQNGYYFILKNCRASMVVDLKNIGLQILTEFDRKLYKLYGLTVKSEIIKIIDDESIFYRHDDDEKSFIINLDDDSVTDDTLSINLDAPYLSETQILGSNFDLLNAKKVSTRLSLSKRESSLMSIYCLTRPDYEHLAQEEHDEIISENSIAPEDNKEDEETRGREESKMYEDRMVLDMLEMTKNAIMNDEVINENETDVHSTTSIQKIDIPRISNQMDSKVEVQEQEKVEKAELFIEDDKLNDDFYGLTDDDGFTTVDESDESEEFIDAKENTNIEKISEGSEDDKITEKIGDKSETIENKSDKSEIIEKNSDKIETSDKNAEIKSDSITKEPSPVTSEEKVIKTSSSTDSIDQKEKESGKEFKEKSDDDLKKDSKMSLLSSIKSEKQSIDKISSKENSVKSLKPDHDFIEMNRERSSIDTLVSRISSAGKVQVQSQHVHMLDEGIDDIDLIVKDIESTVDKLNEPPPSPPPPTKVKLFQDKEILKSRDEIIEILNGIFDNAVVLATVLADKRKDIGSSKKKVHDVEVFTKDNAFAIEEKIDIFDDRDKPVEDDQISDRTPLPSYLEEVIESKSASNYMKITTTGIIKDPIPIKTKVRMSKKSECDCLQSIDVEKKFIKLPDGIGVIIAPIDICISSHMEGRQSRFVSIMSLLYASKYPMLTWSKNLICNVLNSGYHLNSWMLSSKKNIYENCCIRFSAYFTKDDTLLGTRVECSPATTKLTANLLEKLIFDRVNHSCRFGGLIETGRYTCAVLKYRTRFYMFDCLGCNNIGMALDKRQKGDKSIIKYCCLLRFKDINQMIRRILHNALQQEGYDADFAECIGHPVLEFIISSIDICRLDEQSQVEIYSKDFTVSKYDFSHPKTCVTNTIQGSSALRGRFVLTYYLKQCHFCCIAAIFALRLYPLSEWTKEIVDRVLRDGILLYNRTKDRYVQDERIFQNILIQNRKALIQEAKMIRIPLISETKKISFANQLKLTLNELGVILIQFQSSSFVVCRVSNDSNNDKKCSCYYLFDPYPCGEDGRRDNTEQGNCGWTRFDKFIDLKRRILFNICNSCDWYCFYKIDIISVTTPTITSGSISSSFMKLGCDIKPITSKTDQKKYLKPVVDRAPWSRLNLKNMDNVPRANRMAKEPNSEWCIELKNDLWSLWSSQSSEFCMRYPILDEKWILANCIVALILSTKYTLGLWNAKILDTFMLYGKAYLYHNEELKNTSNFEVTNYEKYDWCLYPFQCTIRIKAIIEGEIIPSGCQKLLSLMDAMKYFFEKMNHSLGILVHNFIEIPNCYDHPEFKPNQIRKRVYLAFGKCQNEYFLYDCQSFSEPVYPKATGGSYVLRCRNLDRLINCIWLTLKKTGTFYIYEVVIKKMLNNIDEKYKDQIPTLDILNNV